MSHFSRRDTFRIGLAASAATALPRFVVAQSDPRPVITVAVKQIANAMTLEPLREQSNMHEAVVGSYLETLIGRNLQGALEPEPALATQWRRIDDRTVELSLRRGVKFHNGDEMTAEDVAFNFGPRMFGSAPAAKGGQIFAPQMMSTGKDLPPEVPAMGRNILPGFERIEIVDRYTVRLVNSRPDVTLEGRLSMHGAQIVARRPFEEASSWLDWARRPVGTGPFRVVDFQPDVSLTLAAFDDYWGGRPSIRRLKFVVVPEVSSRINGLLSGEYDFACDIPPDQIGTVTANSAFEVQGSLVNNHRLLNFDKTNPVLADPRVRRAFTHAIDREAIVKALWGGRTRIPKGLQFDFYGPMLIEDWVVPAYDPGLARRLLAEGGYKGEVIPFRLLNNTYINQVATAQVMVEMWRQVGLNVNIQMKENWSQVEDASTPRGVRDWSNTGRFNDPVSSLVYNHGPNGRQQLLGEWSNDEFNRLAVELENGTDPAKRRAAFARMLAIAEREDPAYAVLHQSAVFTGKRKNIGWKAAPSFAMDFRAHNMAV